MNPIGSIAAFQQAFAEALHHPERDLPAAVAALARQPGFAVYRNTVYKLCIDALQANYPAVARLVGTEWFRAAAGIFVAQRLPSQPALLDYDPEFPQFLARFPAAADLPYLPGVGLLDRFWTEAHSARDEAVLRADMLAGSSAQQLACMVFRPHAAARWHWFEQLPVYSIWSCNRGEGECRSIRWQGEGALLARPAGQVMWHALGADGCALLDACAAGKTLEQASAAAIEARPDTDVTQLLIMLLAAGAFSAGTPASLAEEQE